MSNLLGDDEFGSGGSSSRDIGYIAQLGRISGKSLAPNLLRNGVDLTFRNGVTDPDLLYLDVNNMRIGINTDSPIYDLDINSNLTTTNFNVTDELIVDNLKISGNTFSTVTGPINVEITGSVDPVIFHGRMATSALTFNDNSVGSISNQNIVLDPNGTGTIEMLANTDMLGDLAVTGNIQVSGNLSSASTIIVGDSPLDLVTITPDFTQSIVPGTNGAYDFGKADKRWSELWSPDLSNVGTVLPGVVNVSDQITINGTSRTIFASQSNEDIRLLPDTGITYLERTKIENSDITNLQNTPLIFASTGVGYLTFAGSEAIAVPFGDTSERRLTPEVGETRWNSDLQYLECYDGSTWIISTGGGETISAPVMESLGNLWTLILG